MTPARCVRTLPPVRRLGTLLTTLTVAFASLAATPAYASARHGHSAVDIEAPRAQTQVPANGVLPVDVEVEHARDRTSLRVTVTGADRVVHDVTSQLVWQGDHARGALQPSDLVPGLDRIEARVRGHVRDAVVVSWEPAVAVTPGCELLGQARCMLPFPDDFFTVSDRHTDTGRRIDLTAASLPANVAGVHVDPTEWNRNDGFSPGSEILVQVPGLDPSRSGIANVTDIGRSLAPDAPVVLVDTATGARWPYFAELDANTPSEPALIVRPARDFVEGHRYVVALRHLVDTSGRAIAASRAFTLYRDGIPTFDPTVEQRRPQMESIFRSLRRAGVARSNLYLAWDFTVASERNLSERLLHIRDDAFASLHGSAPSFTVDSVQDAPNADLSRIVSGTFDVPLYLSGDGGPGTRFVNGSDGLPVRTGTFHAPYVCIVPRAATAAHPGRGIVYGHGLLGSRNEVLSFAPLANAGDAVECATDWIGMSSGDVGNVVAVLQDSSRFVTLADRLQQGILNFQFLARVMKDPRGFASNDAFRVAGAPVLATGEVFFNGNSQGGIIGGAATAISTEWTRAVLGVPGMNYSTLLDRSTDYTKYSVIAKAAYPDPFDQLFLQALDQMLWDRGEADGYAQHLVRDPYRHTPNHTVLMIEAFGDHQVANVATETEARTAGVPLVAPGLAPGRSTDVVPFWGIGTVPRLPWPGSALVMWDYGNPPPPTTDLPPAGPQFGEDPHGKGGKEPRVGAQALAFLQRDGLVIAVPGGPPWQSNV